MIALTIPARSEATSRFVARLCDNASPVDGDAILISQQGPRKVYSGKSGLFELTLVDEDVDGDVVAVDPARGYAERLIRSGSDHNTLLVTERCDQLCIMCSQPPKKTHVDRWEEFRQAAILAPPGKVIGLSGGEPTLFKDELFDFLDETLARRPDISFHILTNGQHFDRGDLPRLRCPDFARVVWGIPMYAAETSLHDTIVAKPGAHARLRDSLAVLLEAGAHVELRTVVLSSNVENLPSLARYVTGHLGFIDQWSIMQLEAIGFAKLRFRELAIDAEADFPSIATSIDIAELFGVTTVLFNFPLCSVPEAYRSLAVRSISDWKQKYADACSDCAVAADCCGFFARHPRTLNERPLSGQSNSARDDRSVGGSWPQLSLQKS